MFSDEEIEVPKKRVPRLTSRGAIDLASRAGGLAKAGVSAQLSQTPASS